MNACRDIFLQKKTVIYGPRTPRVDIIVLDDDEMESLMDTTSLPIIMYQVRRTLEKILNNQTIIPPLNLQQY